MWGSSSPQFLGVHSTSGTKVHFIKAVSLTQMTILSQRNEPETCQHHGISIQLILERFCFLGWRLPQKESSMCRLTVWGADGLVSRTADCWTIQKTRSRWSHLEEKRRTQIRAPQTARPLTLFPLCKHDQNIPASQRPGNYTHPHPLSVSQQWIRVK